MCGAIEDLPWSDIWFVDNPVEVLHKHLLLLVGRFILTKVIRVSNRDKPWFDEQCRHAFRIKQEAYIFVGPVIAFGITAKSLSAVK